MSWLIEVELGGLEASSYMCFCVNFRSVDDEKVYQFLMTIVSSCNEGCVSTLFVVVIVDCEVCTRCK